MRRSISTAVVLAPLLLAGCGGSTEAGADAPTASVSPTATATATATATSTAPAPPPAGPAFVADTREQAGQARGRSEVVTGVRTSTETGYEQVVLSVKGEPGAIPGFRVGYVDSPTADPSGKPVPVPGKAYLQVSVSGVSGTPPPEEIVTGTVPGTGAAIIGVVVGPAFEGMHQFFIGVDAKRPFRVRAGADPGEVVVQLLTT